MHRYELPQPSVAQKNDIGAWQESVDNSMAQLEHQANRSVLGRKLFRGLQDFFCAVFIGF